MPKATAKRNGKIELLRFIMCISVLAFHINIDLWDNKLKINELFSWFKHGRTAVEFFFILSGFFIARSALKLKDQKIDIGRATATLVGKKIKGFIIPHFIVILLMIIIIFVFNDDPREYLIKNIPGMFLMQLTGITKSQIIGVEWYLASLLFALMIVYPILLKNYDIAARLVAPMVSVFAIGYQMRTYNELGFPSKWNGILYEGNIRAVALVFLGVFAFEISRYISVMMEHKPTRIVLIVIENVLYLGTFYYVVSNRTKKEEGIVALMMALAVAITMCRDFSGTVYDNKLVYFLGKISLTVYICQNVTRTLSEELCGDADNFYRMLFIVVGTLLLGLALYAIDAFLMPKIEAYCRKHFSEGISKIK